jgi:hypothetical protein
VRKTEGKRPLARHWCRWEDNIKTYLQEIDGGVDWINFTSRENKW